jgi:hypothetical protein
LGPKIDFLLKNNKLTGKYERIASGANIGIEIATRETASGLRPRVEARFGRRVR